MIKLRFKVVVSPRVRSVPRRLEFTWRVEIRTVSEQGCGKDSMGDHIQEMFCIQELF